MVVSQVAALSAEKAEGDLSGGHGFGFGMLTFLGLVFAALLTLAGLAKHLRAPQEERARSRQMMAMNTFGVSFLCLLLAAEILYFVFDIGR